MAKGDIAAGVFGDNERRVVTKTLLGRMTHAMERRVELLDEDLQRSGFLLRLSAKRYIM